MLKTATDKFHTDIHRLGIIHEIVGNAVIIPAGYAGSFLACKLLTQIFHNAMDLLSSSYSKPYRYGDCYCMELEYSGSTFEVCFEPSQSQGMFQTVKATIKYKKLEEPADDNHIIAREKVYS